MKNVQCRTQAELDAALKDPNVWPELVGDGSFEIYDSSQVTASGSSQVTASKYVAVTKDGKHVRATGGVQIDYLPPQNLDEWLEEYSIQITDGVAIVYKAVGSDFKSERGGDYTPASTPECDRWDTTVECGGGLHVCGTPHHALGFYSEAKRFVALPVTVDSIAHWPNGDYPTKVKVPRVVSPGCYEVDINGERI